MREDFNYIKSRGLPGGPNEDITYVTGIASVEGYRYDSPDKSNSVNLIESGNISMSENDGSPLKKGPLLGIDNLGNKEVMTPGTNYSFPGDQVLEIPMAQGGNGEFRDFKGIPFLSALAAGDFANHQHHNSRLADLYRYYSGRPLEDNILQVSNTKPTKAKDPDAKYISLNKNQQLVQEVIDNYNRVSNGNFYTNETKPDLILDVNDNEKQLDKNNYKVTGYKEVNDIDDHQLNAIGNYFTGFGEDENGMYISYYDKFDQAGGLGGNINFGEKLGLTKPFEIYDRIYVEKDKDSGKYIQKKKGGGSVSWKWKGKSYSGSLIPSMETESNRYARTKNGKVKTLPKAQDSINLDGQKGSSYDYSLRDAEKDVNEWLGYSMGKINNIGQILSEDQMKTFHDFDENIENQVAAIYQEYRDKDYDNGLKRGRDFEMDKRVVALRKQQADWNVANPIYQETKDLINEGMDPLRHSSSSAKTSKVLQQKVRDIPYVGGVLDFFGVDNAAGFIGSNLAGIGHEAVTIGKDERPWSIKGKESLQDIYNNYVGSLVGNQNLNEKDTINKLVEKYKSGVFADGKVFAPDPPEEFSPQIQRNGFQQIQQDGGSTEDVSKTYMNYINGEDESQYAKKVYDKLNRMYYKDAKERGIGVTNFIASYIISNS